MRRMTVAVLGYAVLQAAAAEPLAAAPVSATAVLNGAAMFSGNQPLNARLRGHAQKLPPAAVRCKNCHATSTNGASYGPVLDRQSLTQPQPRRGGPESAFDLTSFCQLLRTGIDPRGVMVRSAMPVYTLTNRQCGALWAYLVQPGRLR